MFGRKKLERRIADLEYRIASMEEELRDTGMYLNPRPGTMFIPSLRFVPKISLREAIDAILENLGMTLTRTESTASKVIVEKKEENAQTK